MKPRAQKGSAERTAIQIFRDRKGTLRTAECLRLGIQPRTLYRLRDSGILVQLSRGVFQLADLPDFHPDWVVVSERVKGGVVCLVSALAFHEITTQVPHAIDIALPFGAWEPHLDYPPVKYYHFGRAAFSEGIEEHLVNSQSIRVYNPDKSVADCFKYRNRIGLDVALEALRLGLSTKKCSMDRLMHYGRICRVAQIMRPYLEAVL